MFIACFDEFLLIKDINCNNMYICEFLLINMLMLIQYVVKTIGTSAHIFIFELLRNTTFNKQHKF